MKKEVGNHRDNQYRDEGCKAAATRRYPGEEARWEVRQAVARFDQEAKIGGRVEEATFLHLR